MQPLLGFTLSGRRWVPRGESSQERAWIFLLLFPPEDVGEVEVAQGAVKGAAPTALGAGGQLEGPRWTLVQESP